MNLRPAKHSLRPPQTQGDGRLVPPQGGAAIRMYRQGMGNCFLLAFAGAGIGDSPVYVLIDCGIHPAQSNGQDVIRDVVRNIAAATGGRLDIVIVTHLHADHLAGFVHASEWFLNGDLVIDRLWLAWTEDESDLAAQKLRRNRTATQQAVEATLERLKDKVSSNRPGTLAVAALADRLNGLTSFFSTKFLGQGNGRMDQHVALARQIGMRDPRKATGNDVALALLKESAKTVHYLRLGDKPIGISGAVARAYVLGPSTNAALPNRSDSAAGNPQETRLTGASGLHGLTAALGITDESEQAEGYDMVELTQPFDRRFRISIAAAANDPFFCDHYGLAGGTAQDWRQIGTDWLAAVGELALALNSHTNNMSLVLAFELGPEAGCGPVLLFAGDAQCGNWLSWGSLSWQVNRQTITAKELLARTVVYKVGHHASRNVTQARDEQGERYDLELMPHGIVGLIPIDETVARSLPGLDMPSGRLYASLAKKTSGKILRSDDGYDPALRTPRRRTTAIPGVSHAHWCCSGAKKPDGKPLYYDLKLAQKE